MRLILWIAILTCSGLSAAELTPAQCRALGVEVADGRAATGSVVQKSNRFTERCSECHGADTKGESAWLDYHQYSIRYRTETARRYAVCRAEYEVQFVTPPSKPTKPR